MGARTVHIIHAYLAQVTWAGSTYRSWIRLGLTELRAGDVLHLSASDLAGPCLVRLVPPKRVPWFERARRALCALLDGRR